MVKLRKILAIIYLLALLVLLGGLAMYWFALDPVASFMKSHRGQAMMDYVIWALLAVSVVGSFGYVVRTLSQRGRNTFQRSSTEHGPLQVSRAAIVREVNAVVDGHPEVKRLKTSVTIKNRRKPYVNVAVRISPRGSIDIPDVASTIQSEIKQAVKRLTGNEARAVTIDVRKNADGDDYVPPETGASSGSSSRVASTEDSYAAQGRISGEGEVPALSSGALATDDDEPEE